MGLMGSKTDKKIDPDLMYDYGFHVLMIMDDSIAAKVGIKPYYHFIISIADSYFAETNQSFRDILENNVNRDTFLQVYDIRDKKIHRIPFHMDNIDQATKFGLTGRFCYISSTLNNVWRIMSVYPNSPALVSGMTTDDYIVGADCLLEKEKQLYDWIYQHDRKPMRLYCFNITTENVRVVMITPDSTWGGLGSIGCDIGYGYLHRISTISDIKKNQTDVIISSEADQSIENSSNGNPVQNTDQTDKPKIETSSIEPSVRDLPIPFMESTIKLPGYPEITIKPQEDEIS
ncbi:hypothetical protein A3Q56_01198 [Intoshia linei]|uniref:PDZ GRASP-type domain-containing protein n=1 Tax=Intoshia linei TaxID=1819745 RepID=A0A177BC57_9BILA|nr:hypothetical protein A3Q56_01198 [Intoshia linei]